MRYGPCTTSLLGESYTSIYILLHHFLSFYNITVFHYKEGSCIFPSSRQRFVDVIAGVASTDFGASHSWGRTMRNSTVSTRLALIVYRLTLIITHVLNRAVFIIFNNLFIFCLYLLICSRVRYCSELLQRSLHRSWKLRSAGSLYCNAGLYSVKAYCRCILFLLFNVFADAYSMNPSFVLWQWFLCFCIKVWNFGAAARWFLHGIMFPKFWATYYIFDYNVIYFRSLCS